MFAFHYLAVPVRLACLYLLAPAVGVVQLQAELCAVPFRVKFRGQARTVLGGSRRREEQHSPRLPFPNSPRGEETEHLLCTRFPKCHVTDLGRACTHECVRVWVHACVCILAQKIAGI